MANKKLETIKLSEIDINELLLYNGRLFFVIGDDIYCEDYVLDIKLMFDDTSSSWIEVKDLDTSAAKDYDFQEALVRFKDCLPWPYFDQVLETRKLVNEKIYEAERKRNTKKVIGWMSIDDLPDAYHVDDSDEGFVAVVEDIKKYGWACSGMEMSNRWIVAILNTHEYVSFSDRSWGRAMAAANGDFGQMDYCKYAFGFSDEIFDDDPVFPKEGLYKKEIIKNSIITTDEILDEMTSFFEESNEAKNKYNNVNSLVADFFEDGKFYDVYKINLISPHNKEAFPIVDIRYFDSKEKFDEYYQELKENCAEDSLVFCDVDSIHKMIEKAPIYLLNLMVL